MSLEGENFGIHPSGFGELTKTQNLMFNAREFNDTTTEDSDTGDIRFTEISFHKNNSLYAQVDTPALHRCGGISHTPS